VRKSIYSPVFHTSVFGYQMCLRLYLNGDYDAQNQSMSLFLVLVRGTYDPILPWPFTSKVTFSLIDQSASNDSLRGVTRSFSPDPLSSSFRRPVAMMNDGYGFKNFVPLELLRQNPDSYVKEDTFCIHVNIDPVSLNCGTVFSELECSSLNSVLLFKSCRPLSWPTHHPTTTDIMTLFRNHSFSDGPCI
jgi:hypothetical protein